MKTDNIRIGGAMLDGRVKLLPSQKEHIKRLHSEGASARGLAAMFNVSRRLIQFILDPNKAEQNKKRRAERGGSMSYYSKDKHREYMRKHRAKKKAIKGLLINTKDEAVQSDNHND